MNRLLLILTFALQYASALQLTRRALPGAAAAATAIGTQNALPAAKPVLVLGANGGTGLEHDSSVRDRHYAIKQITQVREVPAKEGPSLYCSDAYRRIRRRRVEARHRC